MLQHRWSGIQVEREPTFVERNGGSESLLYRGRSHRCPSRAHKLLIVSAPMSVGCSVGLLDLPRLLGGGGAHG
jgi:hypothetical protein